MSTSPATIHFIANTEPRFRVLTIDKDAATDRVLGIRDEPVIGWRITDNPAGVPCVEPLHASLGSDADDCRSDPSDPSLIIRFESFVFLRYPNGRIESLYEGDGAAFDGYDALLRTLDVQGLAADTVQFLDPAERAASL